MHMQDEKRINAPRERVFAALNNPEILKQAIPGCQELKKISDTHLSARVFVKVGPVKAKFNGAVTLSDIKPPESYRISGEGKGGAAGFAKGGAKVELIAEGDSTLLRFNVDAEVGGKLAQIGNRLIDSTSKKLANEFFETFSDLLSKSYDVVADPTKPLGELDTKNESTQDQKSLNVENAPENFPRWILILGAILTISMALLWWTGQT
ncbi:MAG: hypothetical protein CBB68_00465 [Rhodospirillaceae bacterium TMED8]|nr:carbon monoxide dehydrogenase [Magnetovibrio sp.]OUT53358.1 MAG: hypothetical protein CBB68_00465 [Rhodospirillaceae bacterium TMED8]